ncbi:MAG: hypothetical protein AUJ98_06005 [Bacteroidetes bacterium CG2_30_33_31]|nr:MAG: hypothetical protein AUJ98_06005 [Bacteroidetes bacterium CG2_30_33_31]
MILKKLSRLGLYALLFLGITIISFSSYNLIIAYNIQKENSASFASSQISNHEFDAINKIDILLNSSMYSIIFVALVLVILFTAFYISQRKYGKKIISQQNLIKIQEEDDNYRFLFNNSIMPMAIHQKGKIILINKSGLDFLEAESFDDIKNIDIIDFIHPDKKERSIIRISEVYQNVVRDKPYLEKFITLKGNIKIAELSAISLEINNDLATQITLNDITEQTKYLEEIKNSEEKYRNLFEKHSDAVFIIKDGLFYDCNESAVKIFGLKSCSEMIGQNPSKFSPASQPDGRNSIEKADEMIQKAIKEGFNRFDWLHIRPDNSKFWMDITLTKSILQDETILMVIGRDITEMKRVFHESEKSKEYLNNIVKKIPFPIIIYNDSNEVTFINDAMSNEIGFILEDIPSIDDWWKKTIPDNDYRQETRENWDKAIVSINVENLTVESSWVIDIKNGEKRSCEFFMIKIGNDNLVIINDITENILLSKDLLIAKEKAEESNRLKSAFLANLSHEVRTPMNGIMGFSQLLGERDLDDEERQSYVDIITKSGNRLLNMINDIISISKIDANQVELDISEFDILSVINEIVNFYKLEASKKGLVLFFENKLISDNILIESDEGKLKQILSNLIGNAIKYTPKGNITVTLLENINFIEIQVSDTGYGMKQERLESIFDRFVRLDETLDKTEGTGLGLSISLAYAKRINSEIKVESKFGEGSKFTLLVPFDINHKKPAPVISKPNTKREVLDLTGKSILIAEDEPLNYMILKLFLEETNASVAHANNGAEAVEMVGKLAYDFVFMDIKMPIMNGFEAMKIIKSKYPKIPVVAQTAYTFSEDREKAFNEGFDDYLSKPLSRDKIMEVLRKFFV